MNARDIMSKSPSTVSPDTPIQQAARIMKDEDVGVVPVVKDEKSRELVGMLTDRDIAVRVVAEGKSAGELRVQDVMSTGVTSCRENDPVDRVMDVMGKEQIRRVPIVDERGALVGIIAQADIVREAKNDHKAEETVEKISKPGGKNSQ